MGFFINESITLAPFGFTVTTAYVTIRGRYAHDKTNFIVDNAPELKYHANSAYYVTTMKNSELVPIQTGSVKLTEVIPIADAIDKIYAKIKLDFPGNTFTDDL